MRENLRFTTHPVGEQPFDVRSRVPEYRSVTRQADLIVAIDEPLKLGAEIAHVAVRGADYRTVPTHYVVACEKYSIRPREAEVIARMTRCVQDSKTSDHLPVFQKAVRLKRIVRKCARNINRQTCTFAQCRHGPEMIGMVMCQENSGWVGSQILDDCFEMCTVFCGTGVDNEPTVSSINDIAIRPVIGHLPGIARNDPQDSLGYLDALRTRRVRLSVKHVVSCHSLRP